jgi:hypothetical protein
MVLGYNGITADQRTLVDLMRTTNTTGTDSPDLLRGLSFSPIGEVPPYLQSAPLSLPLKATDSTIPFPDQVPAGGYPGSSLGLVPYSWRAKECWLEGLTAAIDAGAPLPTRTISFFFFFSSIVSFLSHSCFSGLPAIVLQWYDETHDGGHYRVVTGYNATHMVTNDPWDRQDNFGGGKVCILIFFFDSEIDVLMILVTPRNYSMTRASFCSLWSINETALDGSVRDPYFAVYAAPLNVTATVQSKDFD